MTMNRMYHRGSDTDTLYISRKGGGRGLLSIIECVENEERNLSLYLEKSTERLLQLVRNEGILPEFNETAEAAKRRRQEERRNQWREKQLHGKFLRDIEGTRSVESQREIRKGFLKKETEGLIFAAQDQAPRTNWI